MRGIVFKQIEKPYESNIAAAHFLLRREEERRNGNLPMKRMRCAMGKDMLYILCYTIYNLFRVASDISEAREQL